jgi:hypothetical protein
VKRLRIAASGRKNLLFVGNEQARKKSGHPHACGDAKSVNPAEYRRDVAQRISKPGTALEDLLPHRWTPP